MSSSQSREAIDRCSICLQPLKGNHGALFTTECNHMFHYTCLVTNALYGRGECPLCRKVLIENPAHPHSAIRAMGINMDNMDNIPQISRFPSPFGITSASADDTSGVSASSFFGASFFPNILLPSSYFVVDNFDDKDNSQPVISSNSSNNVHSIRINLYSAI